LRNSGWYGTITRNDSTAEQDTTLSVKDIFLEGKKGKEKKEE